MKIINKFLVIILVLLLAFGNSAFAFSDTVGTNYENEAKLLTAFGILNGYSADEFGGEKPLTRAELAAVLTRMLGYSENSLEISEKPVYTDVPLDHWAAAYIYKAYKLGIMTGNGDGAFYPEENVLYNEAIKVMVTALGFEEIAVAKGGYPTGYKSVAVSENVSDGTSASADGSITRGNLAKLIYNTLHSYCLDTYGYDGDNALSKREKTLMETALQIKYAKGVIRAYGDISLNEPDNVIPEGRFLLDEATIFAGETNPEPYVGKNVGVYYRENSKQYTAVYIMDNDRLNTEKIIDAELISQDTTLTKLVYKKDKNTVKLDSLIISDNAEILYNNRLLTIKKDEDLHIKDGRIRLIDNNRDNKYDVVFIEEYDTYVVQSVASTVMTVKTKFGKKTLNLNDEKNDISVKYYLDGEEATLDSVAVNNVLSVTESKNVDGTVIIRIYISQNTAEGTVTEIKNKNGEKTLVLDSGEAYELNNDYLRRLNDGNSETTIPEAGKNYTLYLDINGKIAHLEDKENVMNYGYMLYAKVFNADMENVSKFRIFTKDAEFVDFEAKENIIFNNVSTPSKDVVAGFTDAFGDTDSQLIVYKVNSDNVITEIMSAVDKTADELYTASDGEFVLNYASDKGLRFYKNMAEYKPYHYKASVTIQFMVPTDKTREKDYKVLTKLASTDVSLPGPLKIYNVKEGGQISAVVTGTSASSGKLSQPVIVDSIGIGIDDEGEPCKMLNLFGGTSLKFVEEDITYNVPKSLTNGEQIHWSDRVDYTNVKITDLEKGDVIEYTLSSKNQIDELRILLRVSDLGNNRMDDSHIAENGNMIGDVVSKKPDGSYVVLSATSYTGTNHHQSMQIAGTVYRYSSEDNEVYYSSRNEIEVGDKLLINSFWWSARFVYIIR